MEKFRQERRVHPRAEERLPLKIAKEDFDIITQTKNLSASGTYCPVNKFIPEMTKLEITLILPRKNALVKSKPCKIKCGGVVVRVNRNVIDDNYNIGIFFNGISKRDRERISEYVNYCLTTQQEE